MIGGEEARVLRLIFSHSYCFNSRRHSIADANLLHGVKVVVGYLPRYREPTKVIARFRSALSDRLAHAPELALENLMIFEVYLSSIIENRELTRGQAVDIARTRK
jgi:hypothetical protein